jgi:hypothetical protein
MLRQAQHDKAVRVRVIATSMNEEENCSIGF